MTENHAEAGEPALQRLITLDALRGFAVMGILAMNIVAFAMPFWAYVTPLAYGGANPAERGAWFLMFVFLDGKMRGFFSLLFGASMMLIIDRATAKGESAAKVHYSRMFWLALIGLAHFFFLWFGDILFLYAAVGSLAFLFRNWSPKALMTGAAVILAGGTILWGMQFVGLQILQYMASQPGASAEIVQRYKEVLANPDFSFNVPQQLELMRGSYAGIVTDKLSRWDEPLMTVVQNVCETLPLMMLGMALKKNGFLTGALAPAVYVRWAKILVPTGIALSIVGATVVALHGYDKITALAVFITWSQIPRQILTVGYAAIFILVIQQHANSAFIARVAATGRAAFSNYLGTSIVMTTIFYGYGFGLFGHISRIGLWGFVVGAWIAILLWSKPWLDRFAYGPFEWVWRSLARMELQPMRRDAP